MIRGIGVEKILTYSQTINMHVKKIKIDSCLSKELNWIKSF